MFRIIYNLIAKPYRLMRRFTLTSMVKSQCKSHGKPIRVNGFSKVTNKTILGNNVNFNGMRIRGSGNVVIGNNFHSGDNCTIITQNHNYDSGTRLPYDNTFIIKDVTIEDNVWLGSQVIILPGVKIGEGAIIQAGSVVVRDIAKYSIAGGSPATVFKTRDIKHYNELKEKGMFW